MQRRSFATLALILAPMFATSAVAIADGPATPAATPAANAEAIARGAYLVRFGSCNDCHTPWTMGPKGPAPDMTRALSGHPGDVHRHVGGGVAGAHDEHALPAERVRPLVGRRVQHRPGERARKIRPVRVAVMTGADQYRVEPLGRSPHAHRPAAIIRGALLYP